MPRRVLPVAKITPRLGLPGAKGEDGAAGVGVPAGGTTGQVLAKSSDTDHDTEWINAAGVGDALVANSLAQFAATTSLELKNLITDETGSGALVFATSPTLVTPVLGEATGTGLTLSGLTASEMVITDGSKKLVSAAVATYPSLTELSYVKGLTSAVQTQLNAKLASSSYTAADVLAKLLTVDGAGSGIDADYLDGLSSAAFQPIDSDLTTIASLTPTTNNFMIASGSAWASRTPTQAIAHLGLDADIATFSLPASTTISAFGATLVDDADASAARTTLGLVIGTDVLAASAYDDATAAETNTGTSTAKYVSPDGLAGSNYGTFVVSVLLNDSTALTTGDGKAYFRVPNECNGFDLVGVRAARVAGTGTPLIQIHNVTQAADMLTTRVSIDSGETDSSTAATAVAIDTSNDDVATGDRLRIDVDDAGTSTTWMEIQLTFRLP